MNKKKLFTKNGKKDKDKNFQIFSKHFLCLISHKVRIEDNKTHTHLVMGDCSLKDHLVRISDSKLNRKKACIHITILIFFCSSFP